MARTNRLFRATVAALLMAAFALTGCSANSTTTQPGSAVTPAAIKIGTLATSDSLPLWVAEQKGYFTSQGLPKVEIVVFQSAQEREAAFASGAIQASMTDIMSAANLQAGGIPVKLPTVMLGANPSQGRFAVVAAPNSGIKSMADLKGVAVGTASSTITEYVLDELMSQVGISQSDVKAEQVPKVPVRFQLMMAGQLKAAVLPEPFITLALQQGATIVSGGDDTKSKTNLSASVLAVNAKFIGTPEGSASVDALLRAWNLAVADINANPDSFRQLLVDKAQLPASLATSYKVDTYPMAAPPSAADIQGVLDWMKARGYLKADVKPQDLLGK
ncbi:MAG: ABC transporter substrate-binding protein [Coriobacteriia bacterium]|nr:ABC transporter substrate-binding protein [Coriobacteriia bacterium]